MGKGGEADNISQLLFFTVSSLCLVHTPLGMPLQIIPLADFAQALFCCKNSFHFLTFLFLPSKGVN